MTKLQEDMRLVQGLHKEGTWEWNTLRNAIQKLEWYESIFEEIEDGIEMLHVIDERQEEVGND